MLSGKVILVTGASRGIGKSIAENFAEQGAVVYANMRLESAETNLWIKYCNESFQGTIIPLYFDVTDKVTSKEKIMFLWKEHKKIDVLVNNAGIEYNENIGMILSEHIHEMFLVNTIALIELSQLVSRVMMRSQSGSVINITSVVGRYGAPGQSVYSATKGAVIAFTKSAAKELGKYNIRVNAVAPGITQTDMISTVKEEHIKKRQEEIPMNRLGIPQDVAKVCLFLASNLSDYVSGQIIGVDGGTTL